MVGNETGKVRANSVGIFPSWIAATSIAIASLVFGGTITVVARTPPRTYSPPALGRPSQPVKRTLSYLARTTWSVCSCSGFRAPMDMESFRASGRCA
jgi:hypothetical protein